MDLGESESSTHPSGNSIYEKDRLRKSAVYCYGGGKAQCK